MATSRDDFDVYREMARLNAEYSRVRWSPIDSFGSGRDYETERAERKQDDKHVLAAMTKVKKSAVAVAPINEKKVTERSALLKELGFTKLHDQVEQIAERATKENLAAIAGYKKIPWDKYEAADKELRSNTQSYKKLALTPVEAYVGQHVGEGDQVTDSKISLPPTEVLEKMAEAKKQELFDGFSIIHVVQGPDPILVGTIKGTKDMFYIAEWGDDISFAEIMK